MSELPPGIVDPRERSLTEADFEAILRFLPAFEDPNVAFTEPLEERPQEPGVFVVDEPDLSPLATEFIYALHEHGWIIRFDWVKWDLGPRLDQHRELLATARVETLRRLLTCHVRADHFSYGHLQYAFESGGFTAILRRLQQLYDARHER
jgi:Family of unknown function (DUF6508)